MADQDYLRAVLNNPDDDAPRLAYAQYLDGSGDPRGRFIQLQVAAARVSERRGNPTYLYLATQADELLATHGRAWTAEIAPLVSACEFHRGFIALVSLGAREFLERAPQLLSRAPIQHLKFSGVKGVERELFASPYLRYARSLDLSQCGLGDQEVSVLAQSEMLRTLRWLSLFMNDVGFDGVEALAASPNFAGLRYVNFGLNRIDPGEQFGHDQGIIVESWMPEEGLRLEERYGRLPWLHAQPETMEDLPPDRYRVSGIDIGPRAGAGQAR